MAESEKELKSLLMKVKEESETQHSKNEDHSIRSHRSWQINGKAIETVTDFIFLGFKTPEDGDCSHEIKRPLLLGRKTITNVVY